MRSSASSCYSLSATRKPAAAYAASVGVRRTRTTPIIRLIRDSGGVTGIKYGLLGTLIAVAAVIMMGTVGTDLVSTFDTFDSSLVAPPPSHARGAD